MEEQINQNLASKNEFGETILPAREVYRQVITVILSNTSPEVRKDLHCLICGKLVTQYYSEARVIIIGEMREVKRPVDVLCLKCKTIYRIS